MKSEDLSPLKGLNLPIVAPKTTPADLAVERIVALPDEGYEIEWSSDSARLTLRAASFVTHRSRKDRGKIEFDTPYFGQCYLERSGRDIVSDWFTEMQSGFPAYSVESQGLEPDDVIEFVRSLDYVRIN